MTTKGKFIVIDGIDASGKSTQLNLLQKRLKEKNIAFEIADFPQYNTKSAGLIEEYLNGKYGTSKEVGPYVASMFFATDRYDASFKIKKWIMEGKLVLSNRYTTSNMGHQGCKIQDKKERKKYFDWLYNLEFNIFKISIPDTTIILDVDANTSVKLQKTRNRVEWLGKERDILEEDLLHLQDARKSYLEIAKDFPNISVVDCMENSKLLSPNTINDILWDKIF